jgi:hypothetical protein
MELQVKVLDFTPQENSEQVSAQVREWICANAFMGLQDGSQIHNLMAYAGAHLYLTLGGYVRNPLDPKRSVCVEATFNVQVRHDEDDELVTEDPEGTRWSVFRLESQVNWPSFGSTPVRLARMRVDMIDAAVQLGEMFDAQFRDTRIWVKGMTKQEREERALNLQKDVTRTKVHAAIKAAIHTTCRGMRVGSQMWVEIPDGWVQGPYKAALENKEYDAYVNAYRQLIFARTK